MADEYTIFENGELRPATSEEIIEIEARALEEAENALPCAIETFNAERSARLSETDWWAVRASEPDGTPMTEAQIAYRAALRTMDDAEGFDPFNPDWPEKP